MQVSNTLLISEIIILFNLIQMDIMTIFLSIVIEAIMYFWIIFWAIHLFEVNDTRMKNKNFTYIHLFPVTSRAVCSVELFFFCKGFQWIIFCLTWIIVAWHFNYLQLNFFSLKFNVFKNIEWIVKGLLALCLTRSVALNIKFYKNKHCIRCMT